MFSKLVIGFTLLGAAISNPTPPFVLPTFPTNVPCLTSSGSHSSTTSMSQATPSMIPDIPPTPSTTSSSSQTPTPTPHCPDPNDYTNDISILNFALTLEHLEAAFYNEGMAKYNRQNFTDAGFDNSSYDYFTIITSHENTHAKVLTGVINSLNGTAVPPCNYSFGIDSVSKFVSIARVLENTGVRAYTGAIANITHGDLQTAGATIATVEGRHASYLNLLNKKVPFPTSFDTPADGRTIVSLAGSFITSCPYDLGFKAFPVLVSSPESGKAGDNLTVSSTKASITDSDFCAFVYSSSQSNVAVSNGTCVVPDGVIGDVLVFIVDKNSTLGLGSDDHVIAGPTFFSVDL